LLILELRGVFGLAASCGLELGEGLGEVGNAGEVVFKGDAAKVIAKGPGLGRVGLEVGKGLAGDFR